MATKSASSFSYLCANQKEFGMLSKTVGVFGIITIGVAVKKYLAQNVRLPLAEQSENRNGPFHRYYTMHHKGLHINEGLKQVGITHQATQIKVNENAEIDLPVVQNSYQELMMLSGKVVSILEKQLHLLKINEKLYLELQSSIKAWRSFLSTDEIKPDVSRAPERFQDSLYNAYDDDTFDQEKELRSIAKTEQLKIIMFNLVNVSNKLVLFVGPDNPSITRKLLSEVSAVLKITNCSTNYNDSLLNVVCGKFLCSLTLNEIGRSLLRSQPYLNKLTADWTKSNFSCLRLIGLKCVWNLDRPIEIIPDGVYVYESISEKKRTSLDIIWFHGLAGSAFYTWRQAGPRKDKFLTCWPVDWLVNEIPGNCRIIFLDYDTLNSGSKLVTKTSESKIVSKENVIESCARDCFEKLKSIGIGRENPVLLIGHSMGGLILKQLLVFDHNEKETRAYPSLLDRVEGILFLSTPHLGSPIAKKIGSLPSRVVKASSVFNELGDYSKCMLLNSKFMQIMLTEPEIDVINVAESLPTEFGFGISLNIVPLISAYPGFGRFRVLKLDHMRLSKPTGKDDELYNLVKEFVISHVPLKIEDSDHENHESVTSNNLFRFVNLDYC